MLRRALGLLLFAIVSLIFATTGVKSAKVEAIHPTPSFRTPKNIIFSTKGGGSSHHMWVFEILEEAYKRGHNVSFYSVEDQLRFSKDYPMISTYNLNSTGDFTTHPLVIDCLKNSRMDGLHLAASIATMDTYPSDFFEYQYIFETQKPDLAICDSFANACIDAALLSNTPVIITTTASFFGDFSAPYIINDYISSRNPTIEDESLLKRIYRKYIQLPLKMRPLKPYLKRAHALQRKLGLHPSIDTFATRYNDVPKLINNVFGIEMARPASPLVNLFGPVMRTSYVGLDEATSKFLDTHKKVVYVAFGQHVIANKKEITLIFTVLLQLLDQGSIDGILWGRLSEAEIPEKIQITSSATTHGQKTFTRNQILESKDVFISPWAPQYAILQHPSTSFFVTHGGVGSMHEALYSGVRLFVFPYFGDQPANARAIERNGLGRFVDITSEKNTDDQTLYKKMYKKLSEVAVDQDGEIQEAVNQFMAHMQIRAVDAVRRGADILEESLFASDKNGKLMYRRSVGYDMSYMKRNGLDVYAVFGLIGFVGFKAASFVLSEFIRNYKTKQLKLKQA